MADETHSMFPFESQKLLDMSTPSLLNTQSSSCDSGKLQSQTGTTLQQNDLKFQGRTLKPASSARQISEYQHFKFSQGACRSSSKDQRPHSLYSWNSLLKIQDPGSQKHRQNDLKSVMGSLFRSLLTVVPFGNSSSGVAGGLDMFTTSVSQSLLHIQDLPTESFKEIHRNSLKDIRTHLSRQALNESFTDISCNSFTEIRSDFITDITNDSFTDVSSDSLNDVSQNACKYTSSNAFNSQSSVVSKDAPGDLFKHTPGCVYEDAPGDGCIEIPGNSYKGTHGDLYKNTPLDLYTGTSAVLYKDTSCDLYSSIARTVYKETSRELDKDTNKDVNEDTSKYSYNNTSGDSLEDTLGYSLKDTSGNSLRDALIDSIKDVSEDSSKDALEDLIKDILRDSFKNMPADSFKDTLVDSLNDTLKDLLKDELGASLKDAHRDSLKDALEGWLRNTIKDSLKHKFKENFIDAHSNLKASKAEHTFDDKPPTTHNINTTVYFSTEHQFLETTSSLRHQWQTTAAKQETSSPLCTSLSLLGVLANFLFVAPCVVAFWNSTWCFFDYILVDYDCQVSVWTSAALGFPLMAAFTFFQNSLFSCSVKCNSFGRFVLSRTYTYILGVACISQWRSVWIIANCYVGRSLMNSAVTFAVVFLVLLFSRCLASLSSPPVFKVMEVPHADHYKISTFQGKTASGARDALLDTVISVFGIHILTITYWRTFWDVLDFCLLPDDPHQSAIWSVGISVALSCILLILQRPVMKLSRYLRACSWLLMLLFQDLITVLYSIVCITYWRGVWMLLDLYTPSRPNSLYITHGASFGILVVCLSANSLLVRNVDRDGGECISFDVSFVATLIQTLRRKTDAKYRTELLLKQRQCPDAHHL